MSDERAAKRPRLSSHDGLATNIRQSADFWLPDGNIVLQTPDGTRFRVHKGTLAMNSLVFRDMFATVVSDSSEQQLVDGCAMVEVQDDKADWDILLAFLYKPTTMNPDRRDLTANNLLAMLRLARKYQCDALVARAEERIMSEFPTSLHEFHQMYEGHLNRSPCCSCGMLACGKASVVGLINYCALWDLKAALPVAYFLACARLEFEEVLDGVDLDGGKKLQLCPEAQRALLRGREYLKNDILEMGPICTSQEFGEGMVIPHESCTKSGSCSDLGREHVDGAFLRAASGPMIYAMALRKLPLDELVVDVAETDVDDMRAFLCSHCLTALQVHTERCRKAIFSGLPLYFDLGKWGNLRKKTSGAQTG